MRKKRMTLLLVGAFVCLGLAGLGLSLQMARAQPLPLGPAGQAPDSTVVLYDGAAGGTPDTQGFLYITQPLPPPAATQIFSNGVTILDTMPAVADHAGYFSRPGLVPSLNRDAGFRLNFTVQLESETHSNNDRAGFSVILLAQDLKGIELGFWEDEIWAQADDSSSPGDLFTHAEGVAWETTAGLLDYELAVVTDTYTLLAGGIPILTGPVRDYTNFNGLPDPYETPNLIFLGDDTTSARARVKVAYVSIHDALADPVYSLYLPVITKP